MISIFGIISIIMKKNTLCTNKICVIYFFPNCVNFLPEKVYFIAPPVCAPMVVAIIIANKEKELQHMVDTLRSTRNMQWFPNAVILLTMLH